MPPDAASSPWSPFQHSAFRALWLATVASNIGTWMHEVGAAWLMTSLAPTPLMVALIQTATTLPVFMLALPAGALADVLDRRRVLMFAQLWMLAVAAALTLLALTGAVTAWSLLALTFLLGVGTALAAPAWQAIIPELVPRSELPPAIALNSAGINVARAVGPAVGGLIVAAAGPGAAFLLNAVSFLGIVWVLFRWERKPERLALPAERISTALRTGLRYVRHAPRMRTVLVRALIFIIFGSALWALLPLLARREMGLDAFGYGALLGCIGVGAVGGTVLLVRLRRKFSVDWLVAAATVLMAGVFVALSSIRSFPILCVVMLGGGAAWLTLLSTFQTGAQLALPSWVRARALAVYLIIFFGGMAGGSVIWGLVAEFIGIPATLIFAAAGLVLGLAGAVRYPLGTFEKLDLTPSRHWPVHDPTLIPETEWESVPVLVITEYQIDPARAEEFQEALRLLGLERKRDGAMRWEIFRDLEEPGRFIEQSVFPSWVEHLRQHERITVADRALQEHVHSFHLGDGPPPVRHALLSPT